MGKPSVSICIPAYNHPEYLEKTLKSVAAQNYTDYELIITDDSDNDRVQQLLSRLDFGEKLRYYRNPVTLGSPRNWNACLEKAKGDLIKIMHHDDWFLSEDSLALLVCELGRPGRSFVFADAEICYESRGSFGHHHPGAGNLTRLRKDPTVLFRHNFIGSPSMTMFKRDDVLRFDERLKWLVDIDFYIRYLIKNPSFGYISQNLIGITAESGTTVTAQCVNNSAIEVFENFYLFNKLLPNLDTGQKIANNIFLSRLLKRFNTGYSEAAQSTGYDPATPVYFHFFGGISRLAARPALFVLRAGNFIARKLRLARVLR